jgi:hypothetical protein
MVAASATAILNDINLSSFRPTRFAGAKIVSSQIFPSLAHAFSTARLNQPASMPGPDLIQCKGTKEMLPTK